MIRVIAFLALSLVVFPLCASATDRTAASCSDTHVQAKIDLSADGDRVLIPAGSCTWTTTVNIPNTAGITLQGAGVGNTIITHGVSGKLMTLAATAGRSLLDIGHFTIDANNNTNITFELYGDGIDRYRFHHITVNNVQGDVFSAYGGSGAGVEFTGLFDHISCTKTLTTGTPHCFKLSSTSATTDSGSQAAFGWALNFGSNHMTYIEDTTITYPTGYGADGGTDFFTGAPVVVRYSTISGTEVGWHGADSGFRGIHSFELYRNTADGGDGWPSFSNQRSGNGMTFDNTITNYASAFLLTIYRQVLDFFTPPLAFQQGGYCDGNSSYDGNIGTGGGTDPLGYPCLDQTGWFFSGTAPGATATLTPQYHWRNTLDGVSTDPTSGDAAPYTEVGRFIVKNREFYSDVSASCSGASCTTGVGVGTLANRPSSCTAGVGYWATDQGSWNRSGDGLGSGVLYKCTATDTWTLHYTPYTYPHPLQGVVAGSGAGLRGSKGLGLY